MDQDDLTPAARQRLKDQERLMSERVARARKAAQAKVEKRRSEREERGFANDDPEPTS